MSARYEEAIASLNNGNYETALNTFEELGTYEESLEYVTYTNALISYSNGDYYEAMEQFDVLGNFKQSAQYSQYIVARWFSGKAQAYDIFYLWATFLIVQNRLLSSKARQK